MRQSRARTDAGCDTDEGLTNIMESDTDTDTSQSGQTLRGASERRRETFEKIHQTFNDVFVIVEES